MIKNIKDIWVIEAQEKRSIFEVTNKNGLKLCVAWKKADAERICQMYNSFPDLLEACKLALVFLEMKEIPGAIKNTLEQAITKAEEETT